MLIDRQKWALIQAIIERYREQTEDKTEHGRAWQERVERETRAIETVYRTLREDHKQVIAARWWEGSRRSYNRIAADIGYSVPQLKRICTAFVLGVGEELGEIEKCAKDDTFCNKEYSKIKADQ